MPPRSRRTVEVAAGDGIALRGEEKTKHSA
jgi:hypothetical protein